MDQTLSAKQLTIDKWLILLGVLASVSQSEEEIEARNATLIPFLDRFPDQAFTMGSLEFVARHCRFFPTYAELVEHLGSWWLANNRPAARVIAINDDVAALSTNDRQWLSYYFDRKRENFAPLRNPDGSLMRPDVTDWERHTLSLVEARSPEARAFIARDEAESAA